MASVYALTPGEDLANQVSSEFTRLKKSGVNEIDFRQLVMNVINRNGIDDPSSVSYLKSEIAKIFAQRRAEKKKTKKSHVRRPKKVAASQRSFRFATLKIG